jgi:anti-sigma factor
MESRFCPKINESVLLRYFTKQLTDREAECVEEWIQASEKNRQIARDVHYILFATTT